MKRSRAHPLFKKFLDKQVNITIGNKTWYNKELYFAGVNSLNQHVITTKKMRYIWYIDNWSKVKIEEI